MATFVLVHGSSCGGWIWHKLSPLLRSRGYTVYTPTLTGLSERAHLLGCGVNLTTHIIDIVNLIEYEDLSNVVLVGNSYAGMVITGVAARVPGRIKLLVYLDAYLPDHGQSEGDLLPPPMLAARQAEAAAHGGLLQPPPPAIFGVTDSALEDWIKKRMTPHPFATYTEPVPAGDAASAALPAIFIHCSGNAPATPDLFAASAEKAFSRGWPMFELAAGHFAMLTAPQEVADILFQVIKREEPDVAYPSL